jgi:hypothetical protein
MIRNDAFSPSPWLILTRLILLGWIILIVIIQIIFLPSRYQRMHSLEPSSISSTAFNGWTAGQIQQTAQQQGLSPEIVAGFMISASLICLLSYWVVGGVLFWRKSGTWTGLLAAFILFGTGPGFSNLMLIDSQSPIWLNTIFKLVAAFIWPTFFVMLYLFPNGKFVPRFTRYLAFVPYLLFSLGSFWRQLDTPGTVTLLIFAFGGLASQVYRYRKVSTPDEHQQTKWIVVAMGIFIGLLVVSFMIPALFPSLAVESSAGFWWEFIGNGVVGILLPVVLPLAIGASILRYRLWDIDIIIRRTLLYSLLTGLLALVYFGGVTLLQSLFTALSGQSSPAAVVLSTLLIAAISTPLRHRLQDFIDRRFYRRKYDAQKALAEFATAARSETDQETLTGKLIDLVDETIQPANRGLWLRPLQTQTSKLDTKQNQQVKP